MNVKLWHLIVAAVVAWIIGMVALAVFSSPAAGATPAAGPAMRPIVLGESRRIVSKALGEERTINIVLPPGYAKNPTRRYPVLYLIDGGVDQDLLHVVGVAQLGAVWGRSSEAIIVGIETIDRRRDLTGPTRDAALLKRFPSAGSSGLFRRYIRNEVKPLVDASYRTDGQDAVMGESLAGLFIVETYLAEPTLFDAYAAIDPSLWWDKEALSKTAPRLLTARQRAIPLYLAQAKEQLETPAAMKRVTDRLAERSAAWCLTSRPDLLHSTIYQQLTPQVLQYLFPPKDRPSAEFGFVVQCSADAAKSGKEP